LNYLEKILEYIFLPSCGICSKLGEGYLCKNCGKEIRRYLINLEKSDKNENIRIKKFFVLKYDGIVRKNIIKYKFNDKPYLYKMFSKIILEDKKACEFIKSYDIIIPVPVHKARKSKRGYNQSELIAKEISKELKIKTYSDVLIKINNNKVQSTLNKNERKENVKNAYKIINEQKINNKNIIIFDDIYTTGSTINECIKTLKKSNVNKIGVLILAKD
jgi:competence protein ComFC